MKPLHENAHGGKAAFEARTLACLRGLPLQGIAAAQSAGVLRFGKHRGVCAWFVEDHHAGCARRLDGKLWTHRSHPAKADHSPGTTGDSVIGWPIGILRAENHQTVIVCEGGPDALAAFAAREELLGDFGIVCLLGSGLTIHESALTHFTGKHVRFIAHNDEDGRQFALRNAVLLASIAAQISIASLDGLLTAAGAPANDLCDVLAFREPGTLPDEMAELFDFTQTGPRVRILAAEPAPSAASQGQPRLVTQDDSRSTQGLPKSTQMMGGRNTTGHFQDLHDTARELASTERGQSHTRLFALARAVLGFEARVGFEDRVMRDAVFDTWFSASRPTLDPVEKRPHYLARFRLAFGKVRIVPGQRDALKEAEERAQVAPLPDIPDAPDADLGWRRLAAVCCELQRAAGNAPFFISMRDAARIATGQRHAETGRRLLEALSVFGVIRCVKRGDARPGGNASEYRYLLP